MKKKILAILLAAVTMFSLLPAAALAADASAVTVYLTVSTPSGFKTDKSGAAVVQRAVTLTGKDSHDINDALAALHTEYCPDGADGYATSEGGITRLWGDQNAYFGYYVNGAMGSGLSDPLSDGAFLDVLIYPKSSELQNYSVFSSRIMTVGAGDPVNLTLTNVSGYDANWAPVFSPTSDAEVTANGVAAGATDSDGTVSLSFDTAGTYVVSARKAGIFAPACVVTVVAPVQVDVSAQQGGAFLVPHQTVSVPYGLAASYGYANDASAAGKVTALDVLVRLHELRYGSAFNRGSCKNYLNLGSGNYISKMFESSTGAGFAVNGESPNDGVLSGGYYSGYSAGQSVISSGDQVEFFFYQDLSGYADNYAWFDAGAGKTSCISAGVGQKISLTLKGYRYMWYGCTPQSTIDTNTAPIGDAQLVLLDNGGQAAALPEKKTDQNGQATVTFDTAGTYYLSAQYSTDQTAGGKKPFFLPYCRIVVGDAGGSPANQATGLAVQDLALSPNFSSAVTSYTLPDQAWGKTAISVKLGADASSTVTVSNNGGTPLTVTPNSESWTPVALAAGTNHLVFKVTPPASAGQPSGSYEVTVARGVALRSLSLSDSTALSPAFSPDVLSYSATALTGSQVKLSALAGGDAANSVVSVNGVPPADSYTITDGNNRFLLQVASADGAVARTYTLTVTGVAWASCSFSVSPSNAVLTLSDSTGTQVEPSSGTSYTSLQSGEHYTYTASCYGYVTEQGTITAGSDPAKTVTLTAAGIQPAETPASWPGFRGGNGNLAVTSSATPRSAAEAKLLWKIQAGTSGTGTVSNAPSPQILVDGCLVYTSGTKLYKCRLTDGSVIASAEMRGSSAYTYTSPTYGAGMIFVPLSEGMVQAFRASDLTPLWLYTDSQGGQDASPLTYDGAGYLYGSFYRTDGVSHFVCIPVTDENPDRTDETKCAAWTYSSDQSFYWAGAAIAGSSVVVGSDGGVLRSFRKTSGAPEDTITVDGDIRSSVLYSAGRVYWTTKSGKLCSAAVGENGKFSDRKETLFCDGGASTSTPVLYGGKLYFSGGKYGDYRLYMYDADTLNLTASAPLPAASQSSWLLSSAYESRTGKLYLYGTANSSAGPLLAAEANPEAGTLQVSTLYAPAGGGYCISSPVCGSDGTIYYKNDSGCIFAIGTKAAAGCPVIFSVSPANASVTISGQTALAGNVFDLPAGTYSYIVKAAGYATKSGNFAVTPDEANSHTAKTVEAALSADTSGGNTPSPISVRLQVKVPENDTGNDCTYKESPSAYSTLTSRTVQLTSGQTVFDVLNAALTEAGIPYVEKSRGYIQSIDTWSEFDHGQNSGWLYMVNGTVVSDNCREYTLNDGDSVMWFYTDDYAAEYGSEAWSGKNGVSAEKGTTVITPDVTVTGGTALASVSRNDLSEALASVQKNGSGSVSISAVAGQNEKKAMVTIDRGGAEELVKSGAGASMVVVTSLGSVTIPDIALSSLVSQAGGSEFSVVLERAPASDLKLDGVDLTGASVVRITVVSNGSNLTSFGGKTLILDLPVQNSGLKEGASYRVAAVSDSGRVEMLPGKIFALNEKLYARVATYHLSTFAATAEPITAFADVPSGAWCYDAVTYLSANGWMLGTTKEPAFGPDGAVTRGMLVQTLYRMSGSPAGAKTAAFADVKAGSPYADAVDWAAAAGILSGYGNDLFGPQDPVSRQQLAVILYRYAAYRGYDTAASQDLSGYADWSSVANWARDAVKWAGASNIIQGTGGALLSPADGATRAQLAVVLTRFCRNVAK